MEEAVAKRKVCHKAWWKSKSTEDKHTLDVAKILLNVENDWDGDVYSPEVMGPCCLISEEEVAADIKGF